MDPMTTDAQIRACREAAAYERAAAAHMEYQEPAMKAIDRAMALEAAAMRLSLAQSDTMPPVMMSLERRSVPRSL